MYKNKKILAIVLARSGSKGIVNKNIIKIKNKSNTYYKSLIFRIWIIYNIKRYNFHPTSVRQSF